MSQVESQTSALRHKILALCREYSALAHSAHGEGAQKHGKFIPGETTIPYAGRVFDGDEVEAAARAVLDFWLTLGPEGDAFEREFGAFLGVKRSILVNSGSSANLLAVSALTSVRLPEHKRLRPGDEVITCAGGFPTTVAPIIQNQAVAVFIDNDPITGNADVSQLEDAFAEGRTKAVIFAHALGNPFKIADVLAFCRRHDLWLIEDNCDALGSTYNHAGAVSESDPSHISGSTSRYTGTWGDISTQSFYPPHHLTLGEGGAVNVVRDMKFKILIESFRDWGRDCWCASGVDNTCGKRFGWSLGELPKGYDHKYTYSHLGYNLKPLDVQAAIGREQLRKLPRFIEARKSNWEYLRKGLDSLGDFFEFSLPTHAIGWDPKIGFSWDRSGNSVECSWFGFLLLIKRESGADRNALARFLNDKKIGHRMLFGGNLLRQPAFVQLRKDSPNSIRTLGECPGADRLMNDAIFLGTYPGLSKAMLDYVVDSISLYAKQVRRP